MGGEVQHYDNEIMYIGDVGQRCRYSTANTPATECSRVQGTIASDTKSLCLLMLAERAVGWIGCSEGRNGTCGANSPRTMILPPEHPVYSSENVFRGVYWH